MEVHNSFQNPLAPSPLFDGDLSSLVPYSEEWLHIPNPAAHPLEAADWVCSSDFTHSLRKLKEAQAAGLASQWSWKACLLEHALKCMETLELLSDTHPIRSSVYHAQSHVFCESGMLHSAQCARAEEGSSSK